MKKAYICLSMATLLALTVQAQEDFKEYYPIGEDPNMRYMSSYTSQETILFEANPNMKYSFFNNFYKELMNNAKHTFAVYVAFRPQLRMYQENSEPVKMASQKVFLGTQQMWKLLEKENSLHFIAFSFESGHYSNGQSRSALSDDYAHNSRQDDSLYTLITNDTKLSEIINRKGGNFSTNITELIVQYKIYSINDESDNKPYQWHAFQAGIVNYHDKFWYFANFGGFEDEDIKLYGRWRYLAGYEYMRKSEIKKWKFRWSLAGNIELISGAHNSVNPFRGEVVASLYPFVNPREFGFFATLITGHDNYNLRFVDSGTQFTVGIKWNQWPDIQMFQRIRNP